MNDSRRIDSHKLTFHPHRVAQWRDATTWEKAKTLYPLYVEISPSGACPHRCSFCAVDFVGYKPRLLDTEILGERIREMSWYGIKSIMFAGEGEPLLHKDIDDLVMIAVTSRIDVAFTTNAVLLNKLYHVNQCSWIKASVNAGTESTYMAIHKAKKGDWEKVWKNLTDAVKRKGNCEIGAQMVLLPENEHEVDAFRAKCEEANLDYAVIKPYSQHKNSITRQYEGWKPITAPISSRKMIVRSEAMDTEGPTYDKCNATPNLWCYIMANGDVYSCSAYLLDERFKLGNINHQSFRDIWEGDVRRRNWEFVRSELDIKECRVNCRMDKANRYLAEFDTVKNVNFI